MSDVLLMSPFDGALVARSVRKLAREVHRSFASQTSESEVRDLFLALDDLESWIDFAPASDLSRWVSSLRTRLEGRFATTF